VRSGDSLWAIGQRFGHSLDTIYEWNDWTRTRGLRPGAEILLPPPNA
jgi:LysM repeat protein